MTRDEIALDLDHAETADEVLAEFRRNPENERLLLESRIRFDLSEYMKLIREEAQVTQQELARRVGRSQPLIAKLEAGGYDRMGFSGVRTYARAIGRDFASIDEMFRPLDSPVYTGSSTASSEREINEEVASPEASSNLPSRFKEGLEQTVLSAWAKQSPRFSRTLRLVPENLDPDVAA